MRNREEFESYVREKAEHKITVQKRIRRAVTVFMAVVIVGIGAITATKIIPANQNKMAAAEEDCYAAGNGAQDKAENAGIMAESGETSDGSDKASSGKFTSAVITDLSSDTSFSMDNQSDVEKLCSAFETDNAWNNTDEDDAQIDSIELGVPDDDNDPTESMQADIIPEMSEDGFEALFRVELKDGNNTSTVLISKDSEIMYDGMIYLIPGIAEKMREFFDKVN